MRRRLCFIIVTLVALAVGGNDAFACGDKFLRPGRSTRIRGYGSVHPSAILIYAPRWTRTGIAEFEKMLKRGGHKPVTVTTPEAMSQAFVAAKYEVLIASYHEAGAVGTLMETVPSRPALLPLVYKATKLEEAAAQAAYRCLLRPETMTQFQALEEIDRLLDLRVKELTAAAGGK